MGMIIPFNPLDKANLAESIERALASSAPVALRDLERFNGAGIYALYYTGDFPAYERLSQYNKLLLELPIYVGKADSKGRRKGGDFLVEGVRGTTLWTRLCQHGKSIEQAENLDLDDFVCRFLVVDDLWVPLGESLLISKYAPIWNSLVDGFGNHDPGKGRLSGMRPRWDTLHPGRRWAEGLSPNPMQPNQIIEEIKNELESRYEIIDDFGSLSAVSPRPSTFGV